MGTRAHVQPDSVLALRMGELVDLEFWLSQRPSRQTHHPWFELPTLHRELFGENPDTVIRLWPQLVMYVRYRRYRIFHDAPGLEPASGKDFCVRPNLRGSPAVTPRRS